MSQTPLSLHQTSMGQYLRDPENTPAPNGLDKRRASIYSDLVFNNIKSQLAGGFPVIHSILSTEDWQAIVREFLRDYRAQTPYFTKLSAEFVSFIANKTPAKNEHDFLLELAHYERVELDLYMMDEAHERTSIPEDTLLTTPLHIASTTQLLAYAYPVHKISPTNIPTDTPVQATYLLLFQDDEEEVRFFEVQPLAYRLIEKISDTESSNGLSLLSEIAEEMNLKMNDIFIQQGKQLLSQLNALNIFVTCSSKAI